MRRLLLFLLPLLTAAALRAQITTGPGGFPEVILETTTPPGELMTPRISTDLVTWEQLAPVTVAADGTVRFTDYGGFAQRRRFYHAAPLPGPGTWLVYERRTVSGTSNVFRCHFDGTGEKCLTPGRYPRVSPDGRWMLFTRNGTGPSGHFGASIYFIDLNQAVPGDCLYFPTFVFNNDFGEEIVNFAWEPDNFHFVLDCGGRIYRTSRSGGPRIAYFSSNDCVEAMPCFRPDGGRLVFSHRLPSQLAARSPGGAKNVLTPPGLGDSWPQWSPDGTRVAACDGNTDFTRTDLGHDLLLIDPVTGSRTSLTQLSEPGDGFPCGGAWSANSLWIYAAGTVNGIQGMWRVPATGGAPQPVAISSPFDIAPGISTAPVVFVGGIVP